MAEVIPISIPPKVDVLRHRRIEYRLSFLPSTREWEWSFTIVSTMKFDGRSPSYDEAMTSAKVHIDLATGA